MAVVHEDGEHGRCRRGARWRRRRCPSGRRSRRAAAARSSSARRRAPPRYVERGQAGLGDDVVGQRPPHRLRAQRALGQVERLLRSTSPPGWRRLRKDTTWWVTSTSPSESSQPAPRPALAGADDADVGDLARRGAVRRRRRARIDRDVVLEVEVLDQPGLALVHVDRAGVGLVVRAAGVDGADHPAGVRLDQLHRRAAGGADVGEVGGPAAVGPEPAARPPPQQPGVDQLRRRTSRAVGPKSGRSASVSGDSWAAAHRCGPEHVAGWTGRRPTPRPARRAASRGG